MSSRLGAGPIRIFLVTCVRLTGLCRCAWMRRTLQGPGQPPRAGTEPGRDAGTLCAVSSLPTKSNVRGASQRRRGAARQVLGLVLDAVLGPGHGREPGRLDGLAVDGAAAERPGFDARERTLDFLEVGACARDARQQAIADGRLDRGVAAVGDAVGVGHILEFT